MSLQPFEHRTVSAPLIGVAFGGVLAGHCAAVVVLYRARVMNHASFANSDALVFWVPLLLAAAAYFLLLRLPYSQPRPRGRTAALALVAILAALLSSAVALIIAFNTYGT